MRKLDVGLHWMKRRQHGGGQGLDSDPARYAQVRVGKYLVVIRKEKAILLMVGSFQTGQPYLI